MTEQELYALVDAQLTKFPAPDSTLRERSVESYPRIAVRELLMNSDAELVMPEGKIEPLGYVVMQHGLRGSLPPKAYQRGLRKGFFPG
jgi:hypothetical protein